MSDRTPLQAHPEGALVLGALARRVRRRRESLGWTQAQLAARAGLSVRFLARVESGDGNISVIRLHELAHALGVEATELLRPVTPDRRLVTLVGMRGAGKSTVGPLLARALDAPFIEMDDVILDASGLSLDQIFELHGERYYRRLERETFERLLASGEPAVVAAAGGVVNESATWKMMLREATVVWLRALPEDHWNRVIAQGDRRPMSDNPDAMAELRAMLAVREPVYRQAHIQIDTHGFAPDALAASIERHLADASAGGG